MKVIPTILAAASAALYLGAKAVPGSDQNGPVLRAATVFVMPSADRPSGSSGVAEKVSSALNALASSVHRLSHPRALQDAFNSYFAFRAAHPEQVKRPYFYFVDYGLSNTTPRGYVFDMDALRVIDGPFMVAQGRGSPRSLTSARPNLLPANREAQEEARGGDGHDHRSCLAMNPRGEPAAQQRGEDGDYH